MKFEILFEERDGALQWFVNINKERWSGGAFGQFHTLDDALQWVNYYIKSQLVAL